METKIKNFSCFILFFRMQNCKQDDTAIAIEYVMSQCGDAKGKEHTIRGVRHTERQFSSIAIVFMTILWMVNTDWGFQYDKQRTGEGDVSASLVHNFSTMEKVVKKTNAKASRVLSKITTEKRCFFEKNKCRKCLFYRVFCALSKYLYLIKILCSVEKKSMFRLPEGTPVMKKEVTYGSQKNRTVCNTSRYGKIF